MFEKKIDRIKLLLMDVDGVLTDGRITYNGNGRETKQFSVKDGLGIRLLLEAGVLIGLITGRSSNALTRRCADLGINYLKDSVKNKAAVLEDLLMETAILAKNVAFVGDDLPDLPIMIRVGFPIAVADANDLILKTARLVTVSKGGQGAIRELAELILKSKGKWKQVIKRLHR